MFPYVLFILFHAQEWLRERKGEKSKKEQKEKESHSETASAKGWFCFRNWNVSRLDFYFQFAFQIQLPKLFDLSPCLLTRKRTLGLLSWELGAHVETLARIHILAKFSHTKGPAREKRKDESCSRLDFKGHAAEQGPAQAPPSEDIRRGRPARVPGPRAGEGEPAAEGGVEGAGRRVPAIRRRPEAGPHAKLRRLRKVFRQEGKEFYVQPIRRAAPWPADLSKVAHAFHSILGIPPSRRSAGSGAGVPVAGGGRVDRGSRRGAQP